ncbi:cyclophilin-like fold protein [Magnetovibrio sp.]|uniref:cyclophilin-like fold protein n=1 Tax=Magnetovibrio sp. TaxID=2024836 RepID=UPI002F92A621
MRTLKLTMGEVVLTVRLLDTPTADALYDAAPFSAIAQTWGDEVYFDTPVVCDMEDDARDVLQPGEMGFWLAGNCIAIPYGPTPVSRGDELRLASAANIWGHADENVRICATVSPGDDIMVERADG